MKQGKRDDAQSPQGIQRNPEASLRSLRVIWAALLAGQVFFLFMMVNILVHPTNAGAVPPKLALIQKWCVGVFMVMAVLAGFIVRKVIYSKAIKSQGAVTMAAYFTGTLVFLAMCEGASFFGMICILMTRSWWPVVLIPAAAMALQAINFPTGGAVTQEQGGNS